MAKSNVAHLLRGLCLAAMGSAQLTVQPSLRPSFAAPSFAAADQAFLGGPDSRSLGCVAVGAAEIPGCAQECFAAGAAALGCQMDDLACQCQQQARMMAGAESCVAEFCPSAAYQRVIDGAMSSKLRVRIAPNTVGGCFSELMERLMARHQCVPVL